MPDTLDAHLNYCPVARSNVGTGYWWVSDKLFVELGRVVVEISEYVPAEARFECRADPRFKADDLP